ncbi:MAG: hypothetical protein JWO94_318 [Verrucomicrobiaceae bacterium]|nr:hypothetical protein [Verrucomicrobiaceae bacterium]
MDDRMTVAEHAAWAKRRTIGRWRYIIRHGLLTKGALLGGLAFAAKCAGLFRKGSDSWPNWLVDSLLVALVYGFVMGWLEWSSAESRYVEGAESDDPEAAVECLKCGAVIPAGESRCPECGWSFDDEAEPRS